MYVALPVRKREIVQRCPDGAALHAAYGNAFDPNPSVRPHGWRFYSDCLAPVGRPGVRKIVAELLTERGR